MQTPCIHSVGFPYYEVGCVLVDENRKTDLVLNSRRWLRRVKDGIVRAKTRDEARLFVIQNQEAETVPAVRASPFVKQGNGLWLKTLKNTDIFRRNRFRCRKKCVILYFENHAQTAQNENKRP
ncbi:MAG: hypothetical protein IJV27_02655 [Prevotella sp.]|nr:hypothetical protein [Prevotella sp.]